MVVVVGMFGFVFFLVVWIGRFNDFVWVLDMFVVCIMVLFGGIMFLLMVMGGLYVGVVCVGSDKLLFFRGVIGN